MDNVKQKFTRFINKKNFPEERYYHITLKFKILLTNCKNMFNECICIKSIDLSNFD